MTDFEVIDPEGIDEPTSSMQTNHPFAMRGYLTNHQIRNFVPQKEKPKNQYQIKQELRRKRLKEKEDETSNLQ